MKIGKIIFVLMLMLSASVLTGPVYSQKTINIKIGAIISERSPWDKALKRLSRKWAEITGGKVKLKIYAGGIAGSEKEMVEKMHSGKLGGVALTLEGISGIYKDVSLFYTPLLFANDKEFNYVFGKVKPFFEEEIEKKGIKVISWSSYGWVRFFSKKPVFYPGDLKKHKLSITAEKSGMLQAAKDAGFHPVQIDINDLMINLQNGDVNAFYLTPVMAVYGEYYTIAPNMCSLKVSPVIGIFMLSKKAWEKIPEQYKKKMMEVARKESNDLYQKIVKLEKEAIEEMEEYDLIVNKLPDDARKEWEKTADKFIEGLKGKVFSEAVYKRVRKHLDEYREKHSQRPK